MKKLLYSLSVFVLALFVGFSLVACGNSSGSSGQSGEDKVAEKVELSKVMFGDVEFENSKETKLSQENNTFKVSGTVDAMSKSQKIKFGDDDVTHVVALKFNFDKERTISTFKIQGDITKVYSDSKDVQNYVGSITELLDSEDGEDAFCYLILSAKTEEYKLVSTYTDGTESSIKLEIVATLATATAE